MTLTVEELQIVLDGQKLRENWSGVGRPPKQRDSYQALAKRKGVLWVGLGGEVDPKTDAILSYGILPSGVKEKTLWYCPVCTRGYLRKTYHSLDQDLIKYGCRCQGKNHLKVADYHAFAESVGLLWFAKKLPANIDEVTEWYSLRSDELIRASYKKLNAFGKAPVKELRRHMWYE